VTSDEQHVPSSALAPAPAVPEVIPSTTAAPPDEPATARAGPRVIDLITGTAKVGVGAAALVAGELTNRSVKVVRDVLPAGIADSALETVERQVERRHEEARRNERQYRDDVSVTAESVLNHIVVGVVDMLDMEQLIDHVPIDKVVGRVDLPAVIDEIDLVGVVRQSTTGLGAESLNAARAGLMALDLWSAHVVDVVLRRKGPRDLEAPSEPGARPDTANAGTMANGHLEIRNERGRELQGLRAGFVSRAVASSADVVLVLCVYAIAVLIVNIAWDLFTSRTLSIGTPPHWCNGTLLWILLVAYLTASWGSSGRTLGKQVMGLRVFRSDGTALTLRRAFLRAVLCASFFPGLLLALLNRRNRGLEDVAFSTVVTYDWLPREQAPLQLPKVDVAPIP